ncbi:MAG: GNAT family N-acetyltransferase [Reichenbachiella sp.]|uniref:GNAT family N-acetyltransferase n=1 Tax=Reichenbachiella sp. TaxID=2184521 RepID=UPI003263E61F
MKNRLNIKIANDDDFNSIYNFVNELEQTVFNVEDLKRAFESNVNNPDHIYLIAEMNDESVGYLSCHSQLLLHHGGQKIAEIQEMYVNPESRKNGIGKGLVDELKRIAKLKEIEQLEVTSNNKRGDTHRFYEREKFVQSHKKFTYRIG